MKPDSRWSSSSRGPVAGVLLAVVLYYSMVATGAAAVAPLQEAVIAGDIAGVRRELGKGIEPDHRNASGSPSTHFAAYFGHREVLALLLDAGADVNGRSTLTEETPLHRAALGGHVGVVEFLLSRGAEIDARTRRGESALLVALANSKPGAALTLLERGADVTGRDGKWGRSPLHHAVLSGRRSMVEAILDRGASVSPRSRIGQTPLHDAAAGLPSIMSLLIDRGADPHETDLLGNTPVHIAAIYGCPTCAERLLALGVDPTSRDRKGRTASELAELHGHTQIASPACGLGRSGARRRAARSAPGRSSTLPGLGFPLGARTVFPGVCWPAVQSPVARCPTQSPAFADIAFQPRRTASGPARRGVSGARPPRIAKSWAVRCDFRVPIPAKESRALREPGESM